MIPPSLDSPSTVKVTLTALWTYNGTLKLIVWAVSIPTLVGRQSTARTLLLFVLVRWSFWEPKFCPADAEYHSQGGSTFLVFLHLDTFVSHKLTRTFRPDQRPQESYLRVPGSKIQVTSCGVYCGLLRCSQYHRRRLHRSTSHPLFVLTLGITA